MCPTRALANALRGFDDLGVVLPHPGEQLADGRVVLIRAIELEEPRSAGEARSENPIAFQIVDCALNDAQVFIKESCQLTRV
ncbi:MAG: hypothetical protein M3154_08500 [Candidatus Eremiobacteraeota bacterium]|nr:hypothetical protein [Candidatus Eremiobacteraeota bacterium]